MILPEYLITEFTTGRYQRLAGPLYDVYVSELVRFTDNVVPFLNIFPEQEHFIATLFFEQQLNPMLKAYVEAKKILVTYTTNENIITDSRNTLESLCANACANNLLNLIKDIENLENNQRNLQNSFYYQCSKLYPISALINNIHHIN